MRGAGTRDAFEPGRWNTVGAKHKVQPPNPADAQSGRAGAGRQTSVESAFAQFNQRICRLFETQPTAKERDAHLDQWRNELWDPTNISTMFLRNAKYRLGNFRPDDWVFFREQLDRSSRRINADDIGNILYSFKDVHGSSESRAFLDVMASSSVD